MGFKIDYKDIGSSEINLFLDGIKKDCEKVENEVLEILVKEAPKIVSAQLKSIKRKGKMDKKRLKHMSEDVRAGISKDGFGHKVVKVKGGKKTGTLWHIVNDGTYRSQGHHFIDKAMNEIDVASEFVVDKVMAKEMGNG